MIVAGDVYVSKAGHWTFEVETIRGGRVWYLVLETGQRCEALTDEFRERVRKNDRPGGNAGAASK